MTRTLPAGMLTSAQAEDGTALIWLLSFAFSGGTTRICTAAQDIDWNGDTYTAVGGFMNMAPIVESGDNRAAGVELTLSAVDTSLLSELLSENYVGRVAEIFRAHGDPSDGSITAVEAFSGEMNGGFDVTVSRGGEDGGSAVIKARLTSRVAKLRYRQGVQMNLQSNARLWDGDLGFEYVAFTATRRINWGKTRGFFTRSLLGVENDSLGHD